MSLADEYLNLSEEIHSSPTPNSSGDAEGETSNTGIISTLIGEVADGVLVSNTISKAIAAIDDFIHDVPIPEEQLEQSCSFRLHAMEPTEPSKFNDFEDSDLSRLLSYFPLEDKRKARLICRRWQNILDKIHLRFHYRLNRQVLKHFEGERHIQIVKLTICNILDVTPDALHTINALESVKELEFESLRAEDYEPSQVLGSPTIGEANLVYILKRVPNLEVLTFNLGAVGNFGLELLEVKKDVDQNEIIVGWQWPTIKVSESMSAMTKFLCKILGDLDDTLVDPAIYNLESEDADEATVIVPSDPPVLEVTYKSDPPPPFPAFLTLASVRLERLEKLSVTVQPTRSTERIGMIALLYVVKFPVLRTLVINVEDYTPDEALYRCIFRFIASHHVSLRHLTFINPVLSSSASASLVTHRYSGLEKVKLRSLTIAWEVPLGLELYWAHGHYLLECQRRLSKLEFHTSNGEKVELVIGHNYRFLTEVIIDISDTPDEEFDCSCFAFCAKLRLLVLRVSILVQMRNVNKLPDTIEALHWDAMYTKEDIRWFSRFLILAKAIYIYHDKEVPMDIFVPFTFADFIHFVRLPCLEQLYLPRINIQDPRVTRFCDRHSEGLSQRRDMFLIDRRKFKFQDAFAQFAVNKNDIINNNNI